MLRLGWLLGRSVPYDSLKRLPGPGRFSLLTHPGDIQNVLVGSAAHYTKDKRLAGEHGYRRMGQGIMTSTGERHRQLRRRFQGTMLGPTLGAAREAAVLETRALLPDGSGGSLDLTALMPPLALRILLRVLFGPGLEVAAWAKDIAVRQRYTEDMYQSKLPFRGRWLARLLPGYEQASSRLRAKIASQLELRLGDEAPADLATLMLARAETTEQAADEILTMMSAGHETDAQSLTFTLWLLARHPAEQAKARLASSPDDLEAVFHESLRLFPPVWIFSRVSLESSRLPSGAQVAAGDTLLLCPYLMHRHPRFFEQPDSFQPQRFLDASWRAALRGVYFPFGAGAHVGLGVLSVAREVLQIWELSSNQASLQLQAGIVLRPRTPVRVLCAPL